MRLVLFRLQATQIWCTIFICCCFLLLPSSLYGKIFKVNSTYDVNDLSAGNGLCVAYLIISIPTVLAACTLRAAIEEANALPGKDMVWIPSGTYYLSIPGKGEDESSTGDLDITDSLILVGDGAGKTIINAGKIDRAIDALTQDINVTISNLSIENGQVSSGLPVDQSGGGGIRNNVKLSLEGVEIKNNRVEGAGSGADGGGIKNLGTCNANQSSIENNYAHKGGGFVNGPGGTMFLSASSVSENNARRGGGGTNHVNSHLSLQNSTMSGNTAEGVNSFGGGIDNEGTIVVTLSTLTQNSANEGGGINDTGVSYLHNSIVANNSGGDCRSVAMLTSRGYNLDSDDSCGLSSIVHDILGVDPLLGPLQENAWGTKSHFPTPLSPVIDRGQTLEDITIDQRGTTRPLGKGYDIGAIEREVFSLPPLLQPILID